METDRQFSWLFYLIATLAILSLSYGAVLSFISSPGYGWIFNRVIAAELFAIAAAFTLSFLSKSKKVLFVSTILIVLPALILLGLVILRMISS